MVGHVGAAGKIRSDSVQAEAHICYVEVGGSFVEVLWLTETVPRGGKMGCGGTATRPKLIIDFPSYTLVVWDFTWKSHAHGGV